MGNCDLCGQRVGLFRSRHAECVTKYEQGLKKMTALVEAAVTGGASVEVLKPKLEDIARDCYIPESAMPEVFTTGWEAAVDHILSDGILNAEEETNVVRFVDEFRLSRESLDRKGAYSRVVKAGVIRDLLEGKVPDRMKINRPLPFNFQKTEQLIWLFNDVDYLEDRTKTEYRGGSQGVSVRIMKGVYYRIGAYKGEAVRRTERLHVDTGLLAVTTKHIYFSGPIKSLRVRHDNIVSLRPFSDGIAIVRDSVTAKPQVFVTSDGWFTHNLLANIAQLER